MKPTRLALPRCWFVACVQVLMIISLVSWLIPDVVRADEAHWRQTRWFSAPEAVQAAAADAEFVYAINNTHVTKYNRETGQRLSQSTGEARHLNSGFVWKSKLYCAHSNYPTVHELSEIKVLDPATMRLTTAHDFGDFGGSLTWVLREGDAWWCNFARYGDNNAQTFLVEFDNEWTELRRFSYPINLIQKLGRYSLSGGIWRDKTLLVTGHDDPLLFQLRLPASGNILELVEQQSVPFTGQGFAVDPVTGGLVGIDRAKKRVVFIEPPSNAPRR